MFCLHFDMGKFSGNFVQPSFLAPFLKEMDFNILNFSGVGMVYDMVVEELLQYGHQIQLR